MADATQEMIALAVTLAPLRDICAMSADPGNKRILCLHFKREICGDDREAILAAVNAATHLKEQSA